MVLTVSSIKGGVGKSSVVLLLANNLASRGHKVLVIDMDLNNSITFYYTMGVENAKEKCERQNIVFAMTQTDLESNIIQTKKSRIDLIPSSLGLCDIRDIEFRRLNKCISKLEGYDFILIDTSPTYDNIVQNALYAADYIISPVEFSEFNYNMAVFLLSKIQDELPEKYGNTLLLFNHWQEQCEKYPGSDQYKYMNLFKQDYSDRILDVKLPDAKRVVRHYTDCDELLSINSRKVNVARMANGINELGTMFSGKDNVVARF